MAVHPQPCAELCLGLQNAIASARQHRTTIIVAHRLSTMKDADLILVLEVGALHLSSPPVTCF